MKCKRVVVVAAVAALALGACSSAKKTGSSTTDGKGSGTGTFTVYTSGVYKDIIDRLAKAYTKTHKAVKIDVKTTITPKALKATIAGPGPAVLLLVGPQFKALGTDAKPVPLGQDRAMIAVSTKNPKKVADVTAFAATSGLKTSMCGVRTGFGNTAYWVMLRAKIKPDMKTIGDKCAAKSMQEVSTDKLDAALVFRGGAYPPKGVKLLDIPADRNIVFKLSYLLVGKTPAVTQFGDFLSKPLAALVLKNNGYLP
jgi:ABC-type molybdate transport system substrate-binding protein